MRREKKEKEGRNQIYATNRENDATTAAAMCDYNRRRRGRADRSNQEILAAAGQQEM